MYPYVSFIPGTCLQDAENPAASSCSSETNSITILLATLVREGGVLEPQ